MKKQLLVGLLTLAMGTAAHAVSFAYSSGNNDTINFDGAGHFNFTLGNNFNVTSGSAAGDVGSITGPVGGFTINAITVNGSEQSATVSGTGVFTIQGTGGILSAALTWVDIFTLGTGGGLNDVGSANLTGITFVGVATAADADLVALAARGFADNVLTFQFTPAETLTQLKGPGGPSSTSFSGSVSTPDGGTTAALLGFALVGMATLRRTIKAARA